MSETGSCRGCGRRVLWVKTADGKNMPLDDNPERRFVIAAGEHGEMVARQRNTYVSHFATCPKAAQFRNVNKG